jgi:hypothetical protein
MPTSKNISLLRTMFSDDLSISLTPVLAAVCLGIPSLIYCFHATGTMSPEFRVMTHLSDIPIARKDEKEILTQFVNEVIFGKKVNKEVRLFDLFSSVDEVGKLRWPLCFISPILKAFERSSFVAISKLTQLVDNDLMYLVSKTKTGVDWEVIVEIAFLLRCISASLGDSNALSPFFGDECNVSRVYCITIPENHNTPDLVREFILDHISKAPINSIIYFTPQFALFRLFDGIIAYKPVILSAKICGYQVNSPAGPVPDWMDAGFIIRGNAAATQFNKDKWTHWSEEEVKIKLLGYSLEPLYPGDWSN